MKNPKKVFGLISETQFIFATKINDLDGQSIAAFESLVSEHISEVDDLLTNTKYVRAATELQGRVDADKVQHDVDVNTFMSLIETYKFETEIGLEQTNLLYEEWQNNENLKDYKSENDISENTKLEIMQLFFVLSNSSLADEDDVTAIAAISEPFVVVEFFE